MMMTMIGVELIRRGLSREISHCSAPQWQVRTKLSSVMIFLGMISSVIVRMGIVIMTMVIM